MDLEPIANKIEEMIKEKIKEEGLVKTGTLLNSIKVTAKSDGSFSVEAEDYFKYLDEEHGITESVFNSNELIDFIEEYIFEQIENDNTI